MRHRRQVEHPKHMLKRVDKELNTFTANKNVFFLTYYTEQQKKRIFCTFGIVYKSGFKYSSNDM